MTRPNPADRLEKELAGYVHDPYPAVGDRVVWRRSGYGEPLDATVAGVGAHGQVYVRTDAGAEFAASGNELYRYRLTS